MSCLQPCNFINIITQKYHSTDKWKTKQNKEYPEITEIGFVHLDITVVQQVSKSVIAKSREFRSQCMTNVTEK